MPVTTAFGGTVPLGSIASVTVQQAPQAIVRSNQTRQVSITGDTVSGDVASMTMAVMEILNSYPMPQGYTAETAGSYEDMMESLGISSSPWRWRCCWYTSCWRYSLSPS